MPLLLPLASKRSRAAARDPAAQRAVPMSNFFAETSDQPHVAGATLLRDHARLLALSGAAAIAFSSTLVRLSKASASTAAIFRCAYALGAGLATVLANAQVVILPLLAWVLRAECPGARLFAAIPVARVRPPHLGRRRTPRLRERPDGRSALRRGRRRHLRRLSVPFARRRR